MNKSTYIKKILDQLKYPKELKQEIGYEIESHLYQLDFGNHDYIVEFGSIDEIANIFNNKKPKWRYLIGLESTRKILLEFFATLLFITILLGTWFFWTWWLAFMGATLAIITYILIPIIIFTVIISLFYKKQLQINNCPKQILLAINLTFGILLIIPITHFLSSYSKLGLGFGSIWPLLIYLIIAMVVFLIQETAFKFIENQNAKQSN